MENEKELKNLPPEQRSEIANAWQSSHDAWSALAVIAKHFGIRIPANATADWVAQVVIKTAARAS